MKSIAELLNQLIQFIKKLMEGRAAKLPLKKDLIQTTAKIKEDKRIDRWIRDEPKKLIGYGTEDKYLAALGTIEEPLYNGSKQEVINLVIRDPAEILTKKEIRSLKRELRQNVNEYFILIIDPITKH